MFTSTCCYFVCLCILTLLVINDLFLFMFSVLLTYFSFRPRYVLLRFLRLQSRRIARHLDSGASGQSKIDNTFLKSQQYFCTTGHIASGRTSVSKFSESGFSANPFHVALYLQHLIEEFHFPVF